MFLRAIIFGAAQLRARKAAVAALCLLALPLAAQQPAPVVGVLSYDALPYRDAEAGMREVLAREGVASRSMAIKADGGLPPGLLLTPGSVVVSFGQRAGIAVGSVVGSAGAVTQLSCMSTEARGAGSVLLNHAVEPRMERVRRLLPRGKTLGILVAAEGPNLARSEDFRQSARRLGLELHVQGVDLKQPLGPQLEGLGNRIDALLGTYDLRIFSSENARALMLFSYRHRIPLIGISDAWTRAGALMSFDWDYRDIGRQCGELALKALAPGVLRQPAVEPARRLVYSLNLEAARYFRIDLAPDVLEGARQKFN